jgi:tyrosinase
VALRNCGYTGNLPYWEWGLDVAAPQRSPIFDGSDTSLGGDGNAIQHAGLLVDVPITGLISFRPGTGGGCVTRGPFANMVTRLGPVQLPQYGNATPIGVPNPLGDNSRCLKRDLNSDPGSRWSTFRNVTNLIRNYDTVELFQAFLVSYPLDLLP